MVELREVDHLGIATARQALGREDQLGKPELRGEG